ncbi:VOC family protein [Aquimarina algiphila]|uniref:Glyoxalase/fosfomycin resistance/dioxygenase domain-containing protein n=1 Tax=Aquimarina algiphila TaxID=2047982 RepID=A0A554VED0_9FLAO|nr:VOC family protein [Aquimarina algiphila]TSE05364.1 hypothetical protein FOF46_23150 [Aquimarina algiphila]
MKKAEFHLALPCEDLEKTKDFYIYKLGAKLGRFTDGWIDINLYGNQITFTKVGEHLSFFVKDPNGYMVEFKSFKDHGEIFTV